MWIHLGRADDCTETGCPHPVYWKQIHTDILDTYRLKAHHSRSPGEKIGQAEVQHLQPPPLEASSLASEPIWEGCGPLYEALLHEVKATLMDSSNSEILTHFHNTFLKLIFLQFQEVDSELFLTQYALNVMKYRLYGNKS